MRDLVLEAAKMNLPPCKKCGALRGDPCRKPSGVTTTPHLERMQNNAQEVNEQIEREYS